MGRKRKLTGIRKKLEVLSPIKELSGESRSPTPVGDVTSSAFNTDDKYLSPTRKESPQKSRDDAGDSNDSFRDHLMYLTEECKDQLIKIGRQLRKEREMNAQLKLEAHQYRLDYLNYRFSWEMDQDEIGKLKSRVMYLEGREKERAELESKFEKLEKEHRKLKEDHRWKTLNSDSEVVELRMEGSQNIQTTATTHTTTGNGKISTDENVTNAARPKIPSSPVKVHRRPYTGRSRKSHLAQISEDKKCIKSAKPTTVSSVSSEVRHSPVSLPSIPAPVVSMVPVPPSHSRPSNRRHSRIPLASRCVRVASRPQPSMFLVSSRDN